MCPAHADSTPSLHINREPDGKIVVHCFAGCSWDAIIKAADENIVESKEVEETTETPVPIGYSALDDWAEYTAVPREFWESLDIREVGSEIVFTWPGQKFTKRRTIESKKFKWVGRGERADSLLWPTPTKDEINDILICEGEGDCGILRHCGFEAYTFGSASEINGAADALHIWDITNVTIVFDADRAGKEGAKKLQGNLLSAGIRAKILDLSPLVNKRKFEKDIRDVYLRTDRDYLATEVQRLLTVAEALVSKLSSDISWEESELDWVVEKYLARSTLTLLTGEPKGGKTTWLFALMYLMRPSETAGYADSRDFLGSHVTPGEILYLSEDNEIVWALRRKAHMRVGDDIHIRYISHSNSLVGSNSWIDDIRMIEHELVLHPEIELVVVDTISVWAQIADENSRAEVGPALELLRQLAGQYNISIAGTHYYSKAGVEKLSGGQSGSTAWESVPDNIIEIKKNHNLEKTRKLYVRGKLLAQDPDPITYSMIYSESEPARIVQVEEKEANSDLHEQIISIVTATPGITMNEIGAELYDDEEFGRESEGWDKLRRALEHLKRGLKIRSAKDGRANRFYPFITVKARKKGET